MYSHKQERDTSLHVHLDEPLTTDSCSKIITDLIKYILHQKQQIPFSFDTLMQLETRIKPTDRNFITIKSLLTTLNNLTRQLSSQLHLSGCDVKEIVVIIGATTISPKFCLQLELPTQILSSEKHLEYQHSYRKPLLKLMKSLVECTNFQQFMEIPLGLTNTFVLLKKSDANQKSEFFLPKPQYHLPAHRTSCFSIKLHYDGASCTTDCRCEKVVKVYNDNNQLSDNDSKKKIIRDIKNDETIDTDTTTNVPYIWYQSKEVLKGFKFFR